MQNRMVIAMSIFKYLNLKKLYKEKTEKYSSNNLFKQAKPIFKQKIKEFFEECTFVREKLKDIPATNYKLGLHHLKIGNLDDAIMRFKMVIFLAPEKAEAYYYLGKSLFIKNDIPAAKEALQKALSLKAPYPEAEYIMDKIDNPSSLNTIPTNIIAEHLEWNESNHENDTDLTDAANKAVVHTLLSNITDKNPNLEVLDLGAAEGGRGQILKDKEVTKRIIGIDLRANSLAKSKDRKSNEEPVYDDLINIEISEYLSKNQNKFDTVIAGNVFSYIGNLEQIFTNIASALKPNGLFAIITKKEDEIKHGYKIDINEDNFLHSIEYFTETLNKTGFSLEDKKEKYIENNDFVIFIAKLKSAR